MAVHIGNRVHVCARIGPNRLDRDWILVLSAFDVEGIAVLEVVDRIRLGVS